MTCDQFNTFDEVLSMQWPKVSGYEIDGEYPHDDFTTDDLDLERLKSD